MPAGRPAIRPAVRLHRAVSRCLQVEAGVFSVPERPQTLTVGVGTRDADILELIVGHLQQDQPAAPAIQQAADPVCE
ncbi:hypothetical protein BQ8794_10087 [Mesorhizobium prunaredense]|uniref:Uncharacterized protein n=1 Tax=Mesorhizobium prunaredense TaxID=1631249 RepID=A0A1R3UYL6_9HYPH|nr:hypothetical protein BQ8794_10087 [Mesorhizobium prunaredense]